MGFEWKDKSDATQNIIILQYKHHKMYIRNGYNTIGGIDIHGNNQGLLEIEIDNDLNTIRGNLTADDVISILNTL